MLIQTISAALLGLITLGAGQALAAPDNTQGMALLSANLAANGALLAGSGVICAENTGTGMYEIKFDRSVSGCTCAATHALGTAGALNATINVTTFCPSVASGPDTVHVRAYNQSTSTSQNHPIHLLVFCPK